MTSEVDADIFDDRRDALKQLRSRRRRNRIARLDKFDAFYKTYVTGLLSAVAIYTSAGLFGDAPVRGHALESVQQRGPSLVGLAMALAVAVGLRSGGRGGPLAFERADVRHVLLSPVDRGASVRAPAFRHIRYMAFIGFAVGAAAGLVAERRMPGNPAEWVLCGALFGMLMTTMPAGVAMTTSGLRVKHWVADLSAVAVLAWSVLDAVYDVDTSPFTWAGHIALWPIEFEAVGLAAVVATAVVTVIGLRMIDGLSIETAERRSRLVGQLRFAATMQDVRTVLVLQRQLSQEHLRNRPWIRIKSVAKPISKKGKPYFSVFVRRSLQDLLRWSLFRMVRLVFFVAIAAACAVGVWQGTSVLVIPAGLAMWLASLDLLEPLAQETDHPDRLNSLPHAPGWVNVRHLYAPFVVLLILALLATTPMAMLGNGDVVATLWPIVLFVVWLAIAGAAIAVVRPPSTISGTIDMPEIAGLQFVWKTGLPPALAIAPFVCLAMASKSWHRHHDLAVMVAAINWPMSGTLACGTWAFLWIRHGSEMKEKLGMSGARAVGGPDVGKPSKDVKAKATSETK